MSVGWFGVYNYRSSVLFLSLYNITGSIVEGDANWASFVIGLISFSVLFTFRHINKTILQGKIPIPGELIVVVLACLISYFGELEANYGIDVVGDVRVMLLKSLFVFVCVCLFVCVRACVRVSLQPNPLVEGNTWLRRVLAHAAITC